MKERTIYALGFFDGVHLGHQALLDSCRTLAKASGCKAGVVTFGNHPDALVQGQNPSLLTTPKQREWILKEHFHMDRVLTLPFDQQIRSMPWEDFLGMLIRDHDAAGFVCGDDFRFGYKGQGNDKLLIEFCWYFTGKCSHYAAVKCNKWQDSCGGCPLNKSEQPSLLCDCTSKVLKDKTDHLLKLKNLTPTASPRIP